jgi:hypothetical protein
VAPDATPITSPDPVAIVDPSAEKADDPLAADFSLAGPSQQPVRTTVDQPVISEVGCLPQNRVSSKVCASQRNRLSVPIPGSSDVCCLNLNDRASYERAECLGQIETVAGTQVPSGTPVQCPPGSVSYDCGSTDRCTDDCLAGCGMKACVKPKYPLPQVDIERCADK